jgi:hypothetical protein
MKKTILFTTLFTSLLFAEVPPLKPISQRTFAQSQYIPDISLITDFSYLYQNKSLDDNQEHQEHSHAASNANEGFNFNYAELVLSSSVDPYLNLDAVFHFTQEGVEAEEVYFTTTALEYGFEAKGGQFLSDFGRLNAQHHHTWNFSDNALVNNYFLGGEGLSDLGVQLQWLAPLDNYLMFGVEALEGGNETKFSNQEVSDVNVSKATSPSLAIAYVKSSFDIDDTTLMMGLSYIYGAYNNEETHGLDKHAFIGNKSIYGADVTLKHYFDSYSFLSLQSEYLYQDILGDSYDIEPTLTTKTDINANLSGYYTQLVYAYNQNYRVGIRNERLLLDEKLEIETNEITAKNSIMIEYHPSEFSRFRVQYNNAKTFNKTDIHSVIISANIAIGAHSAHAF